MIAKHPFSLEVSIYSPFDSNKFIKVNLTMRMFFHDVEDEFEKTHTPISHNFQYLFKFGSNEVEKSTSNEVIEKTIQSLKLYIRSSHLCNPAIEQVIQYSLDPFFKEYLKLKYI